MEKRMTSATGAALPCVLATSVIRSTRQGASHGGVYLVDLSTGRFSLIVDWNDGTIDWSGRGGDRGLRGIAFHDDRVFLAASDEIFVYDTAFRPITSIRSPYLRHCHEIAIAGRRLYLTSTGFDSILVFDLARWHFSRGICLRELRPSAARRAWYSALRRASGRVAPARVVSAHLRVRPFDPNAADGPEPLDVFHINSVTVTGDGIDIGGTQIDGLYRIADGALVRVAAVPRGTHNTRLIDGRLVYNDTEQQQVVVGQAGTERCHRLPDVDPHRLENADVGRDHARAGFGRGLCLLGDGMVAAGSSPATITVFGPGSSAPVTVVNLTMDVRNAIHGLEVWPFDRRLVDFEARCAGSSPRTVQRREPVDAATPLSVS
jgi:hypothetical protein